MESSENAVGIRVDVIDGNTGLPASYTLELGDFLTGSNLYTVEYDELTGNIIYTADGTTITVPIAPADSPLNSSTASGIVIGYQMDNNGRDDPSLCYVAIQDTSKFCVTGNVDLNVIASVVTNRRITYRVDPD